MADFKKALKYLLANEGGYVNRATDSGGPTKFGITMNTATMYFKRPFTADDMKALTIEQATEIYFNGYWKALHLDQLDNDAMATCLLDTDVNDGCPNATHLTKAVLKTFQIEITEHETWRDMVKFLNCVDPEAFIDGIYQQQVLHYHAQVAAHKEKAEYLAGWLNRANKLLVLAKGDL